MTVPLIPRTLLFADSGRSSPTLSPDGTWLGHLGPHRGIRTVWIERRGEQAARPAASHVDRGNIGGFLFCHDDRHLVYTQDTEGDENWHLYALDLVTDQTRQMTDPYHRSQLLAHSALHPNTVLVTTTGADQPFPQVRSIDLDTGIWSDRPLPGQGFTRWFVDDQLRIRGGARPRSDGGFSLQLFDEVTQEPRSLVEADMADVAGTQFLGFDHDGRRAFLKSCQGVETSGLVSIDLATGRREVLAADPDNDVESVWLNPVTHEPEVAVFIPDHYRYQVIDRRISGDLSRLRELCPGDIQVSRTGRADREWIVTSVASDTPETFSAYDRVTRQITPILDQDNALRPYRLATTKSFVTHARDGLPLRGYVTFPPGVPPRALPCVLAVHGGPWSRDVPGFSQSVQWLTNRGYVCLQVNFRGSTGYGKSFVDAGNGEWAGGMRTDLLDTVDFAVEQGWVDPSRIAVYGQSFGGYAALMAATVEPAVFRCAIALNAPTSLMTMLESFPAHWRPLLDLMYRRIGDPRTDSDRLLADSPLSRASQIAIPLLLGHGGNDSRVPIGELKQLVQALDVNEVDHELFVFTDEGHDVSRHANVMRFSASMENFLARHLGGRAEPPD
jgi:dipeptidyl aminopeptidase/acylaminoacyl peptidase